MSTEYVNNIAEALLLMEMPQIDKNITPDGMREGAKGFRDYISDNHKKSTNIGDDRYHLLHEPTGGHLYYRHDGKDSKELSFIHSNTQTGVEKGDGGDSSHIHKFMQYHVLTHGKLQTAKTNTPGSRKLWVNFVKKTPQLKFHTYDSVTGNKKKITSSNIDNSIPNIWGDSDRYKNIALVANK